MSNKPDKPTRLEMDRAIMVLRLEHYIQQARDAMDLRTELQAIKMLAQVLGVNRASQDHARENIT